MEAFSVSKKDVPMIRAYILNQEAHHRDHTLDPSLEVSESSTPFNTQG
jgi:hypothetical protein